MEKKKKKRDVVELGASPCRSISWAREERDDQNSRWRERERDLLARRISVGQTH